MTTNDPTIDAIRARRAAITPGEWRWEHSSGNLISETRLIVGLTYEYGNPPEIFCTSPEDDFITNAPSDIDALLAALDAKDVRIAAQNELIAKYEKELHYWVFKK